MAEKLMKYADATKKYDVVFGLETHVELSTNTKLFCPAHIEFGGEPNTELTPVSLGLPGSLPKRTSPTASSNPGSCRRSSAWPKKVAVRSCWVTSPLKACRSHSTNGC